MTHVVIYENGRRECIGCCLNGHAGMAESGRDIVCAAISILVENTVNAIEAFVDQEVSLIINEEEALLRFIVEGDLHHDTDLLLKAMVLGIEDIAADDSYKQYLSLTYEEV